MFLAVAQCVANGLLHLRISEIALAGGLLREQLQDSIALIGHADGRRNLARFHFQHGLFEDGIRFIERGFGNKTEIAAGGSG